MAEMNRACFFALVALVAACGSTSENPKLFGGAGGAAGSAGLGAAGWIGSAGAGAIDAGSACREHMVYRGNYCIDERPAIYVNGDQGVAVSWGSANDACATRGLRLCSEQERESTCGLVPYETFCVGPADTWEWSTTPCPGRRVSPCCTVQQGFGECSTDETKLQSFHCCEDV